MKFTEEHKLKYKMIEKCWEDESFKDLFVNSDNPVELIEEITGVKVDLPEGSRMVVVDQTKMDEIHINIPPAPSYSNVELEEKELELVSAGANLKSILNKRFINRPRFTIRPKLIS